MSEVMQNPNPSVRNSHGLNPGVRPGSGSGFQRFLKSFLRGVQKLLLSIGRGIAIFFRGLKRFFHKIHLELRKFHRGNMRRFTKWADPRLEKYRPAGHKLSDSADPQPAETLKTSERSKAPAAAATHTSAEIAEISAEPAELHAPKSQAEFLKLLQMTPRDVLDYRARQIITMAFQLPKTHASDLMLPKSKITYVHDDEVLGPLTLDRLYKTGFDHFPVVDTKNNVIGTIHTTSFNNLEIKETSVVAEILDPGIYYIRTDYTLEQVLAAFLRVNCYFFLVVDNFGRTVGMLTFARLISFLFGDTITDRFQQDNDRLAVAKRRER